MPREPWGVLDCSEGDSSEGDQSAGETQAQMPVVAQINKFGLAGRGKNLNKLATNYPTLRGWNGWWRGRRRRGGGRSGGVGGGDAEEEGKGKAERLVGEAKEEGEEEAEELVVEERGAIYGGGGAVGLKRRRLLSVCEL